MASEVALQAVDQQGSSAIYRIADATVKNDTPKLVHAIRLHWKEGGPTVVTPVLIPPGATQTVRVKLPAISEQQIYEISLLAQESVDSPVLAEATATIRWPIDQVNRARFIDGRYSQIPAPVAAWPQSVLRECMVVAVVASLAMAATLLIRHRAIRFFVLAAVVLAGVAVMTTILSPSRLTMAEVRWKTIPNSSRQAIVVSARRSMTWTWPGILSPLYLSPYQMQRDTMVVQEDNGVRVVLRAGEVRLFEEATPRP